MSRCFHESVRRGWHLGFKHLLVGLTKQAPFYCLIFIGGKFLLVRYPSRSGPPREIQKRSPGGAQGPRGAPEANQGQKVSNSLSKIDVFKKKHQIP